MINNEIRRFMDAARTAWPKVPIRLFKDFRGLFVAVAGIDMHEFRTKLATPDPKDIRVMWFPAESSCGFQLMIGNPHFAVTEDA